MGDIKMIKLKEQFTQKICGGEKISLGRGEDLFG